MAGTIAFQYTESDERYFKRLRSDLLDGGIYNLSAVPYTSVSRIVSGTTGTTGIQTLTITQNGGVLGTVSTDSAGAFSFSLRLIRGRNTIKVTTSTGGVVGDVLGFDATNIGTILSGYAVELVLFRSLIDNARRASFRGTSVNFDGGPGVADSEHIKANFGQFITGERIEGLVDAGYRVQIKDITTAYSKSTSVASYDLLSLTYGGSVATFQFFKNGVFAYSRNGMPKFRWRSGFIVDFSAANMWIYRRWWTLLAGSRTLAANKKYWLYAQPGGYTTPYLPIESMEITDPDIDRPFRGLVTQTASFTPEQIDTDTTGAITGVAGNKMVRLPLTAVVIRQIYGTGVGDFALQKLIPGTGIVSLGVDWSASLIGTVHVTFDYYSEPVILARITTNGSAVSKIEFNGRIRKSISPDGTNNGAQSLTYSSKVNAFLLTIPNRGSLDDVAAADLTKLIDEVKPAHKLILENAEVSLIPNSRNPGGLSAEVGGTSLGTWYKYNPVVVVAPIISISAEVGGTSLSRTLRRLDLPPPPPPVSGPPTLFVELGGTPQNR